MSIDIQKIGNRIFMILNCDGEAQDLLYDLECAEHTPSGKAVLLKMQKLLGNQHAEELRKYKVCTREEYKGK